jgi:hypothetical protein
MMDKLFPMVRRVRKPLLPIETELPRLASFQPEKPVEAKDETTASPTAREETPDDAGAEH